MAIEAQVRKWGNSIGVVIPKELAKQKGIKENETILIELVKQPDLRKVFGSIKRKETGQEFKDAVRSGW